MIPIIKNNLQKIKTLCQDHRVDSFALFGSAAKGDLHSASDIDFLVRFSTTVEVLDYADNYFDFLENLERLFGRPVDLVSEKSLKNPILIQEINKSKIPLYEF